MSHAILNVASTTLSRHFSEYLARVRFGGDSIVVLKNKIPVAELHALPAAGPSLGDFLAQWQSATTDTRFADDLEAVNRADQPLENPWA